MCITHIILLRNEGRAKNYKKLCVYINLIFFSSFYIFSDTFLEWYASIYFYLYVCGFIFFSSSASSSRLYAWNCFSIKYIYMEHHNDRIDIYCFHFIGKYRSFVRFYFMKQMMTTKKKQRKKILFVINFNLNCFHATINRERF